MYNTHVFNKWRKKMRLFVSVLIATMVALFMGIVVAYQAFNYGYVTIFNLGMLSFFAFMFGFGVMWCLGTFDDLQEEEKQPMARRVE
jgi:ABC-type transporter Mla maintaining outer membrane lipid asymmetry permease subunit MlaE